MPESTYIYCFLDYLLGLTHEKIIKCSLFISQVFEDTEFHQMEEEVRKEAEKEELAKEIR